MTRAGAFPDSLWPQKERIMSLNVCSSLPLVADERHGDRDGLEIVI